MELYVCRYVQPSVHYTSDAPFYVPDLVIDRFSSLVWCERYYEPGDFVLMLRATPELMRYFADNELMILRKDTDRGMIPEYIELTSSPDAGDVLKITGRSAESLLNRRTILQTLTWNENMLSGTAANAVLFFAEKNISDFYYYHNDFAGVYTDKYRYMPFLTQHNLTLEELMADFPEKITAQPFGKNLGEFTSETAKACGFGYRIKVDKSSLKMELEVYRGSDRTMNQSEREPVIFAPGFNGLATSTYSIDRRAYYNVGYAAGEGEGKDRKIGTGLISTGTLQPPFYWMCMGTTRRERFIDAKSVSSNSAGVDRDPLKYSLLLTDTALKGIEPYQQKTSFSGQALPNGPSRYRRDYFLGDRVSVRNAYISGTATVTEVAETIDESGHQAIPTLAEWRE